MQDTERDKVIAEAVEVLRTVFTLNADLFTRSFAEEVQDVLGRDKDGGIMSAPGAPTRWVDGRWLRGRTRLVRLAVADLTDAPTEQDRILTFKIALLDLARCLRYTATGSGAHDDKPDRFFGAI